MRIKNWSDFNESISGWELVGQHMGPGYPEQKLQNTISGKDTDIIYASDGNFYTYDDFQDIYNQYLKSGGDSINPDFNKETLDTILLYLDENHTINRITSSP